MKKILSELSGLILGAALGGTVVVMLYGNNSGDNTALVKGIILGGLTGLFMNKWLRKWKRKTELKFNPAFENLKNKIHSGVISVVDVRSQEEFSNGHVPGSVNIPLNELPNHLEDIRKMQQVVLCCASGGRSGNAAEFLEKQGIPAVNAGSWRNVNELYNKES